MKMLRTFFEMKPEDVRAALPDRDDWSAFTALVGSTPLLVEIQGNNATLKLASTKIVSANEGAGLDSSFGLRAQDLLSSVQSGPFTSIEEEHTLLMEVRSRRALAPANAEAAKRFVFDLLDGSVGLRARKRQAIVRALITRAAVQSKSDLRFMIAIRPRAGGEGISDFYIQYGLHHFVVHKHDGLEPIADLVRNLRLAGLSQYNTEPPLLRQMDIHVLRDTADLSGHDWLAIEAEARQYADEESVDFIDMRERLSDFMSSGIASSNAGTGRDPWA